MRQLLIHITQRSFAENNNSIVEQLCGGNKAHRLKNSQKSPINHVEW